MNVLRTPNQRLTLAFFAMLCIGSVLLPVNASAGQRLYPGQSLCSSCVLFSNSARFYLRMQEWDGNLVVYDAACGHAATWATHAYGSGHYLIMQTDGNAVVYNSAGTAVWHTYTYGNPGAYLDMQDDGNLVVYRADGVALWAPMSGAACATSNPSGWQNWSRSSCSGSLKDPMNAFMQSMSIDDVWYYWMRFQVSGVNVSDSNQTYLRTGWCGSNSNDHKAANIGQTPLGGQRYHVRGVQGGASQGAIPAHEDRKTSTCNQDFAVSSQSGRTWVSTILTVLAVGGNATSGCVPQYTSEGLMSYMCGDNSWWKFAP